MHKKRGQISIFIIIGIVILIGFSVFSLLRLIDTTETKAEAEASLPSSLEPNSLRIYVESCIQEISKGPINLIGEQGGTLNLTDFAWYNKEKYNYLCKNEDGRGCVNKLILRQNIEKELSGEFKKQLKDCIRLEAFENQGYKITTGDLNVKTAIGLNEVNIFMDYPIQVSKGNDNFEVNDFSSAIESPLGTVYLLAVDIINSELSGGFNKDDWMIKNRASVIIEKHKPYPDTAYKLTKEDRIKNQNYTFKFAINGEDTVSKIPEFELDEQYGCCYNRYDNACYKNTPEMICNAKNASYNPNPFCSCQDIVEPGKIEEKEFANCENHEHGESWCIYDSIVQSLAGVSGMSYVGSRHYKQSCIDGSIYTEECRDYREELCTQQTKDNFTTSACRPNRWQDCAKCATKACCEDEMLRDCHWSSWLETENKCHPAVPPGFRFWEGNGEEVCSFATDFKECEGLSCADSWVDSTAIYCYFQGDCGNFRNIADQLTKEGFFNTDPIDSVTPYVYLDPGLNKNPADIGRQPLKLSLNTTKQAKLSSELYQSQLETFPALLSAGLNYLDYIFSLSISDFLNPFKKEPAIKVLDYSFCSLWSAPLGSKDCHLCDEEPLKPCTEYRCKSLGQLCIFETDKGIGTCKAISSEDKKPPKLSFDKELLDKKYAAKETTITASNTVLKGYEITPAVKPYMPLTLGITTDEEARCKLSFLPNIGYGQLPSIRLGNQNFSKEHKISFNAPTSLRIPKKVYNYLDINSLGQLIYIVTDLENAYERYKEKYKFEIGLYKTITGRDVIAMVDPIVKFAAHIIQPFIDLFPYVKDLSFIMLNSLEQNQYFLFVKCIDRAGNENIEELFIKFSIDNSTIDDTAPIILSSYPQNNKKIAVDAKEIALRLYVNEPSECRYSLSNIDFEQMENNLECPASPLRTVPVAGGSYECRAKIPFEKDFAVFYFKCRDNPAKEDHYKLNMNKSDNFNISGYGASRYLNITPPNTIIAEESALKDDLMFNINTEDVNLILFTNEPKSCRFSSETDYFWNMAGNFDDCVKSKLVDIGAFTCFADIPFSNATNIACREPRSAIRNTNDKSYTLTLYRSEKLLSLGLFPIKGETLTTNSPTIAVVTSKSIEDEGIKCGYTDSQEKGFLSMDKPNDFLYNKKIDYLEDGSYIYYVKCSDKNNNIFLMNTTFKIETY